MFGPSELVTPLPTYRVVIQAEFVSSVSKARDICRSITLRPQAALADNRKVRHGPDGLEFGLSGQPRFLHSGRSLMTAPLFFACELFHLNYLYSGVD